jgi:TonB family protein
MNHDETVETLLDAIHGAGVTRQASDFLIEGRSARGAVGLRDGLVVHARYADVDGLEAVGLLLADAPLLHQALPGQPLRARNMSLSYQAFLLEALHRLEALGRSATAPGGSDLHWDDVMPGLTEERPIPATTGRPPVEPPSPPRPAAEVRIRRRHPLRDHAGALALAGAGALVLVAVVAFAILGPRRGVAKGAAPAVAAATTDPAAGALEASALESAGADLPVLAAGESPPSPAPDLGLRPTVICRLLIDAGGQVVQAEVFQRRPDLEVFEQAALQAARGFRFAPARKDGHPVATWINWPVQFR